MEFTLSFLCLRLSKVRRKALGGVSYPRKSSVNFGTVVRHRTPPGMWAKQESQCAVIWHPDGLIRFSVTFEESFFFFVISNESTLSDGTTSLVAPGRWEVAGAAVCRRMTVCLRGGATEKLYFTCAWFDTADTYGWKRESTTDSWGRTGDAGQKPVRCPPPEESSWDKLPRFAHRTPHLTWSHGRWGEGRRVQAEDAYFQTR